MKTKILLITLVLFTAILMLAAQTEAADKMVAPCYFGESVQKFKPSGVHDGIDIWPRYGYRPFSMNVYAVADGLVDGFYNCSYKGDKSHGGAGNFVVLRHTQNILNRYSNKSGPVWTKYYHLAAVIGLPTSSIARVRKGDLIGIIGNTGNVSGSTGTHLHFEIRLNDHKNARVHGTPKNPREYIYFGFGGDDSDVIPPLAPAINSKQTKSLATTWVDIKSQ